MDIGIFTDDDFLSAYASDQNQTEDSTVLKNGKEASSVQMPSATKSLDEQSFGTCNAWQSHVSITPSIKPVRNIVTPEEVQPYPKAKQRIKSNRSKAGKTMIATDTPIKQAIKEQKQKTSEKKEKHRKIPKDFRNTDVLKAKSIKQLEGSKRGPGAGNENLNKPVKRMIIFKGGSSPSESEAKDCSPVVPTDDDNSADEECLYCCSTKEADCSGEKWCKCTKCGQWTHYLCAGIENNEWKAYLWFLCLTLSSIVLNNIFLVAITTWILLLHSVK